ncbi:OmpH family outer membrane protein [Longimicrobium sp.]|uniref:OmpH family outer membrane protein n=1 Tax=Longimicrobium sp. TaxID=2029185 RepID=UPI002B5278B4|nr:OmpH family outer membrane protein [Longimicrobium sp.]HSU13538.1 OmpH family outer membrane protein [Longimicrobium sp.]
MKRFLSAGVLGAVAALVMGAAPAAAQAGLKIGFVNSQRVLAEAPGVQQVQQTLQRELPGLRAPLDSLEASLQTRQQQFQQQQGSMTQQARDARQTELQQAFAAYQQRVQQVQEQAQRRQETLVAPVMQQINTAIEALRREGGFTMIVDSSAGGIVVVDPALDLTDRVLQRLRGGAAAPPAAPRP